MSYNFCNNNVISDLGVNCTLKKGYENVGWVISRSDLSSSSYSIDGNLVTLSGTNVTTKFQYIGQIKDGFQETTTAIETGTYRNTFTNTVSFKVFQNSNKAASIIDALSNGEYVFVLEQKQKDIEGGTTSSDKIYSTYRIFGLENGCTMTACDNDDYSDDIACGWSLSFEETGATHSALYLKEKSEAWFDEL